MLDVDIVVGVFRQRFERRSVELLEGFTAVARQLLERLLIQFLQQGADGLIQLGQGEKALLAQTRQNPTFDDLYADLGFGFVLRLVRSGRDHCDLVMLGPLLISGIEFRLVAAGFAHATFQVIWNNQGRTSPEIFQHPAMTSQPVRE